MSILIDEILTLLNTKAEGLYGLSNVTQKQHALQCAMLAEQAGETPQIIVAALVHDIGHMLHEIGENFADRGIDDHHEEIGMNYLKDRFGPDVVMPIALHVQAKRYLCATQPDYFAKHKTLDILGDLSLMELNILGNITVYFPGHELNRLAMLEIFSDYSNFSIYQYNKREDFIFHQNILTI